MRWNDGRARFERRANSPFGDEPLNSKSLPSLTEKLMSDGCVATPRPESRRRKLG